MHGIEVDVVWKKYVKPTTTTSTTTTTTTTTTAQPESTTTSTQKPETTTTTKKSKEYVPKPWDQANPEDPDMYLYQVVPEDLALNEFVTVAYDKMDEDGHEAVIDQQKQKSNFKFEEFLQQAIEHSKGDGKTLKSIKLNFKQFENVFPRSVNIILRKHREVSA